MITRSKTVFTDEGVTETLLQGVIREFQSGSLVRMNRAREYYDGGHAITGRVKPRGAPNNKVAAAYPRYIVTMASGYLAGSPVQYASEDETGLSVLLEAYAAADTGSVDEELARDASIYGAAVEIVYFGADSRPRTSALDPRTAFVVYDDTVEHNPLFGVEWRMTRDVNGVADGYECVTHTPRFTRRFIGAMLKDLRSVELSPNPLGRVPIVEYWNNADETGDFDAVIPLIDAYDALQSDRVNDKQGFADSLLVFTGVGEIAPPSDEADERTVGQRLREDKAVTLPDKDASVQWLTKSLNEADTQVLSDSIKSDIHKFAMVPDLSDQNFGGNVSGISLRYKLFGLEQLTKVKERWFKEGLMERLRLFTAALGLLGQSMTDPAGVTITFTRSMPVNELELAQEVSMLQGVVPNELLLTQLPFVTDARAALSMLAEQKEADTRRTDRLFGAYTNFTAQPTVE